MINKFEMNDAIEEYVNNLARSKLVRSFYPVAITQALNLPLTLVIEKLSQMNRENILIKKYEVRCHEGNHIIAVVNDYTNILGTEIYCKFCNEDIYIGMDNISETYFINDEYIKYLKKKVFMPRTGKQV